MKKNILTAAMPVVLASALLLTGCGEDKKATAAADTAKPAVVKSMVFGDTTFNAENEEPNLNPHHTYAGWAAIRYGVGETLFRYSEKMEVVPNLAQSFERVSDTVWKIVLRDDVTFTSGRKMDAAAVKECLDHLVAVHKRAAGDLMIDRIEAAGNVLTIHTKEARPTLMNYLSDPYGCIIDMQAGITADGNVSGTGPYKAVFVNSGVRLDLVRNEKYWKGTPAIEKITVRTISDGDTLTMALQSGEIDAAYGLPYASYPLFRNDNYTFTQTPTSRTFFGEMNTKSPVVSDAAVRRAIAMGIDKEGFVKTLLRGNGYAATGPFPATFSFGSNAVKTPAYDPKGAAKVLDDAGWKDSDGDGIRDKNGQKLTVRWLTYPSRQELPLLAEAVQANLGALGMEVVINATPDHNRLRKDPSQWDVYASAMVTAPTGDPQYFFTSHCLDSSVVNNGGYHSDKLEALAKKLSVTFDTAERSRLAVEMQQTILDDDAFIFCSHLKMSMVSRKGLTGLVAHPTDFYELTNALDIRK